MEARTQSSVRHEEFRRRADAANLLAESALADIDLALADGSLSNQQAEDAAWMTMQTLDHEHDRVGRADADPEPLEAVASEGFEFGDAPDMLPPDLCVSCGLSGDSCACE